MIGDDVQGKSTTWLAEFMQSVRVLCPPGTGLRGAAVDLFFEAAAVPQDPHTAAIQFVAQATLAAEGVGNHGSGKTISRVLL